MTKLYLDLYEGKYRNVNFKHAWECYRILNREWGSRWKRKVAIHEQQDDHLSFHLGSQKLDHDEIAVPRRGRMRSCT